MTGIPYRHPAVLANMAVTVDIASGGRLELGLGAGWFEPECAAYGIEWGRSPSASSASRRRLTVIRSLLTEPTTSFEGRHYRLREAWCEPKALQEPHPPIVLGGKGERRLLPLVARYADQWNYSGDDVGRAAAVAGSPRGAVRVGRAAAPRTSPCRSTSVPRPTTASRAR